MSELQDIIDVIKENKVEGELKNLIVSALDQIEIDLVNHEYEPTGDDVDDALEEISDYLDDLNKKEKDDEVEVEDPEIVDEDDDEPVDTE